MITGRKLKRIAFIFMLIVSIQITCGLNIFVEAAQSHSVYEVQKKLNEKGYDSGPVDGIMGIKTREAIEKFQKDNGLSVSGKLDNETEKKLFEKEKENSDPEKVSAISSKSATTMKHTKPDFFVADQRIQLQAEVKDPRGINLVRCYFKAAGEADMVFVTMNPTGKNDYAAILPAPSTATTQIEYLFLAANTDKVVVRSQNFYVYKDENKKTPAWQEIPKKGEIKVGMELDKVPSDLQGFSDNVTIDATESTARFGMVALLYHNSASSATVSSASTSTGATSAGTVTAGTAGWSTTAIVGVGIGAAAVAGVTVAAASGGGGGGGGGGDNNNIASLQLTEEDILGTWNYNTNSASDITIPPELSDYVSSYSQTWTFNQDGSYTINLTVNYTDQVKDLFPNTDIYDTSMATGTWSLSGNNINLNTNTTDGQVYSGSSKISNINGSPGNVTAFTIGDGQQQVEFTRL